MKLQKYAYHLYHYNHMSTKYIKTKGNVNVEQRPQDPTKFKISGKQAQHKMLQQEHALAL